MNFPKVSIIILNWNGLKDTIECLESLKKITYPNYEVIVVDNGSEGNDADVLEERYGDYIRLIRNKENLGFAGGNNVAMRMVRDRGIEYILILNNDVIVEKNFLEPLVESMLKDENIGIIGPANYDYYHPSKILSLGRKINYWKGSAIEVITSGEQKELDSLIGCCLLIKRGVIDKIGYFYEPYFLNFEETDFCLKAKKAGFKIMCEKKSKIWHKVGGVLNRTPILTNYYYYRNKLLFIKRNASFCIKYPFYFYYSLYLIYKIIEKLIKKEKLVAFAIRSALIDFWLGNFGKNQNYGKFKEI
jgi:hypothetical protein